MAATTRTVTVTGGSVPIPINLATFRYGVGIIVTIPSGSSCTYDVEVTGDELDGTSGMQAGGVPAIVNWNKHDILNNKSASANSNLAYPVTAVRINPSSLSGSVVLAVVQVKG